MTSARRDVAHTLRVASGVFSAATVLIGFIVLLGWAASIPALTSVRAAFVSMKVNTAIGFVLLGVALSFRRGGLASSRLTGGVRPVAGFVILLGAVSLLEFTSGRDFGIDQAFFADPSLTAYPGRMSPLTAISFMLLGAAAWMDELGTRRNLVEALALLSHLGSLLAILGYVYGVRSLYAAGPFTSVALLTAVAFAACSLAVLFAHPESGLVGVVSSEGPGGIIARRLLPAAIVLPAGLGYLQLAGQHAGYFDMELGLALFASANIVGFTTIIWWNAKSLFQSDEARRTAESESLHQGAQARLELAARERAEKALRSTED